MPKLSGLTSGREDKRIGTAEYHPRDDLTARGGNPGKRNVPLIQS